MKKALTIHYEELESIDSMMPADKLLMQRAIAATDTAYNPYSHFSVGAALRLADEVIVTGSNQENIAYPSGLCAERTAMFAASAQFPGVPFDTLAIVGKDADGNLSPASPCGACRQVMSEYETKGGRPLRVLLYWADGHVLVFDNVQSLLPFCFEM